MLELVLQLFDASGRKYSAVQSSNPTKVHTAGKVKSYGAEMIPIQPRRLSIAMRRSTRQLSDQTALTKNI